MTPYSSTLGILETDHAILNYGQVPRTTLELPLLSPNIHTTSTGGRLCPDKFNMHQQLYMARVFSGTRLELMTRQSQVRDYDNDEAHFWLNGYVNKQNYRIWSEANPQVYVETPLHPEKLTVWCALWAGGIIGLQKR
ncbi:hypothetical protein TNCV_1019411 [Trichonephila clavipes]|nr:hypothetical protein TNCV_1019411 [Trichonephila clavipes]